MKKLVTTICLGVVLAGSVLVSGCTRVDLHGPISDKRYWVRIVYGQDASWDCPSERVRLIDEGK